MTTITGADLLRAFQSMQITKEELPHPDYAVHTNMRLLARLSQEAWRLAEEQKSVVTDGIQTQAEARKIALERKAMSVDLLMQEIQKAADNGLFSLEKTMERFAGEAAEAKLSEKGFHCFFYRPHPTSTDGDLTVRW